MMDIRTLVGTFVAIFLAEMGDKTQLAVFGASAAMQKPIEVFLGAAAGLIVATSLAVVLGRVIGHIIPLKALRMIGGIVFVGIGFYLMMRPQG